MGHPEIDNRTPFAFAPLLLADEDGRPLVAPIVKATFDVSIAGKVTLAAEQAAVSFTGKHHGEPGESSLCSEPEVAFVKPATDVVMLGHAHAQARSATQVDVVFRVGPVEKSARVTGDRCWQPGLFGMKVSEARPFERIPLVYERAFGGWDRSAEAPDLHEREPRNPVGVGFLARRNKATPGAPLPNLEDPAHPMKSPGDRPSPVGFGFLCADWQPRSAYAGTYDDAWSKSRAPRLPTDFDRRFFNAASPGLVVAGYLRGDEDVIALGVTPEGRWEFALPGIHAPRCLVALRTGSDRELEARLDTVVVDADARRLTLIWRCFTTLSSGPHDLRAVRVTCANSPAPTAGS